MQKSHNSAPTDFTGGEPQSHCYDGSSAAGSIGIRLDPTRPSALAHGPNASF